VLIGLVFGGLSVHIPLASLGWLALLAMTSQTAGWLLITSSLPRLPAAISSLLLLLQPAAAIMLAAVVLAERPSPVQLGGAVLVCGGVLVATRPAAAQSAG
jgi:drug/metabolite transporter (DMT)-like permease